MGFSMSENEETKPQTGELPADDTPVEEAPEPSTELPEEEVVDSTGDEAAQEGATEETAEEPEEPKTPEEEILMWKETALRSRAEMDNYRKRMTRERADTFKYANQSLLEELLPILDNFEMGMMAAAQDQDSMIFKGMEMVQRQLGEFLTSQGIKEIATDGAFDHNLHEAVSQEESADHEEGQIIRVVRRGFEYQGRLLRPANVIVAAGAEQEAAEATPKQA